MLCESGWKREILLGDPNLHTVILHSVYLKVSRFSLYKGRLLLLRQFERRNMHTCTSTRKRTYKNTPRNGLLAGHGNPSTESSALRRAPMRRCLLVKPRAETHRAPTPPLNDTRYHQWQTQHARLRNKISSHWLYSSEKYPSDLFSDSSARRRRSFWATVHTTCQGASVQERRASRL